MYGILMLLPQSDAFNLVRYEVMMLILGNYTNSRMYCVYYAIIDNECNLQGQTGVYSQD